MFRSGMPLDGSSATSALNLHDVTWMDDLAVLGAFERASQVLPALASMAGFLTDCCLERGMYPNLQAGKTEAVVSYAAPMRGRFDLAPCRMQIPVC